MAVESYHRVLGEGASHDVTSNVTTEDSFLMRTISIFFILVSGLVGSMAPLLMKGGRQPHLDLQRLIRSFSAGVILALALVHILPSAYEQLGSLSILGFQSGELLGGGAVVLGVLLMASLEDLTSRMVGSGPEQRHEHSCDPCQGPERAREGDEDEEGGLREPLLLSNSAEALKCCAAAQKEPVKLQECCGLVCGRDSFGGVTKDQEAGKEVAVVQTQPCAESLCPAARCCLHDGPSAACFPASPSLSPHAAQQPHSPHQQEEHTHQHQHAQHHQHHLPGPHVHCHHHHHHHSPCMPMDFSGLEWVRRQVMAYMLEIGCVFHSLFIGVALGVTEEKTEALALAIALAVHQLLEGLSLGSVVALADFSRSGGLIMTLTYSLTTPVGVALGIMASTYYHPHSFASTLVQGLANAVSAGMLLYIALVQLMSEHNKSMAACRAHEAAVEQGECRMKLLLRIWRGPSSTLCTQLCLLTGALLMWGLAFWA